MYLVEGLSEGRVAIVTKTHQAMVGEGNIDLAEVILDAGPSPRRTVEAIWMPGPEPTSRQLVRDALSDLVRRPVAITDTVRGTVQDVSEAVARVTSLAGGVVSAGAALLRRSRPSPLSAQLSEHRRLAVAPHAARGLPAGA